MDSHLFETILSRLHGIYALSLNSVFDPNSNQKPARLCFERLPELPTARRHQQRQHRRRRCNSRFVDNSSSSCVSCISFSMFDSTSPHNPGQLFCPERDVGCSGPGRSFYCHGCGRNMTGGSSLVSVAGSAESSQRPEVCYSMTRSVEFYRFTKTIQWQNPNHKCVLDSRIQCNLLMVLASFQNISLNSALRSGGGLPHAKGRRKQNLSSCHLKTKDLSE